ncbi:MAG TPA: UvrB/UvrC motif-containing protein [Kiritimatiellia bacterium]|nr:UvrB/UvrC motif-containing protein [Kiritimatiellia bacterium]HRU70888.1 UvrB/UvrC motif-containing protein [Kiritimatiellia bacterium]
MKCELCHKADAETAIRHEIQGEIQELYVCQGCARQTAAPPASAPSAPEAGQPPPPPEGMEMVPLMGMILDAAFEIVGRAMNLAEPACPACGILRHEYRKQSRLGCPGCYTAFSKELDAAIFDLHRATQHVGKVPQRAQALWQRRQLEARLAEAIQEQRYEEAIVLRDELRRLPGPDAKEGGPS